MPTVRKFEFMYRIFKRSWNLY